MESVLFSKIDERRRYCIPKQAFWDMWHSDKKAAIRRLGFMPRPCGEVFGERCKWVVLFGLLEHTSQSYRKEPDPVPEPHKTTPKMRLSDYVEIIEEDEDIGT